MSRHHTGEDGGAFRVLAVQAPELPRSWPNWPTTTTRPAAPRTCWAYRCRCR
ncbi:hypothetical protein JNW88_08850 [Micromonospora sp. ATA32]|nr:hypothetical protein [Micromonospora sp. ATA32]